MNSFMAVDISSTYGTPWGVRETTGSLVSLVLNSGIALAGIIVLFTFIFSGIKIIGGAGNNDPKAAAQGKQALTYAIIGFIVVVTAYWIIRLIEVITGSTFLTSPLDNGLPPSCPAGSGPC